MVARTWSSSRFSSGERLLLRCDGNAANSFPPRREGIKPLEVGVSPWSQSSSRVGACTCAFLPSCSSSVWLPFAWIKGSVAFPRGFPTGLSHVPPFPESPRCLSPFQGNLFSLHCLDFQAEDGLTPRWHVGQPCGKASWESLVGKPRGKATDPLIHA